MALIGKERSSAGRIILDIGTNSIKIFEIAQSRRKIKVLKAYTLEGASRFISNKDVTNLTGLVDAIVKSFKENNVKSKKITIVFPSKLLTTKFEKIPQMTKKELKEYMKNEFVESFPTHTDKTHCMDYASFNEVVTEEETYNTVFLASVPKMLVNNIVKEFKKSGYKIVEVETNLTPLYYVSLLFDNDYESKTKMFVDVGRTSIRIMLLHLGSPIFMREINYGIENVIEDLRKEVDIPLNICEELINKVGTQREDLPIQIYDIFDSLGIIEDDYFDELDRAMYKLITEITKNIEFFDLKLKLNPDKVILMGGGSLIKGFKSQLENYSKKEIELIDIISSINEDNFQLINNSNTSLDGLYGQCLGLALKGVIK